MGYHTLDHLASLRIMPFVHKSKTDLVAETLAEAIESGPLCITDLF